jgi:uncharacterized Zn finger protein
MDEKFERENEILNAVFKREMSTLKGISGLREIGIPEDEAKSLVYEAELAGMNAARSKTPEIAEEQAVRLADEALYESEGGGNG